jgi:SIR2-like domain
MAHILLIGAGFSRNWGGPVAEEITGSLLGDLEDDAEISATLHQSAFEDAFPGFQMPTGSEVDVARKRRFQNAVVDLFARLNRSYLNKQFEFSNDLEFSVKRFLARFDAIFSLNQDLLLEIHYQQTFVAQRKWNGVEIPGMRWGPPPGTTGPNDLTMSRWRPSADALLNPGFQPLYKLHGSCNWFTDSGDPMLIMGTAKTAAIRRQPTLETYQREFSTRLNQPNTRLMVIGYSFMDDHINAVIENAWRVHGLGTYFVDPRGRDVLRDPKMERAAIRVKRDIEGIKLIGELRRPLSAVFAGDKFAHGELMRFFQ